MLDKNRIVKVGIAAVAIAWVSITLLLILHLEKERSKVDSHRPSAAEPISTRLGPFLTKLRDKPAYDQLVFLNNVRIEAGPRGNVMYAVGPGGSRMLVVTDSVRHASVDAKELYDLRGILRAPPTKRVMRRSWGLTMTEADSVGKQGVYLNADIIRVN